MSHKKRILVGLSWGVDSAVSAYLLKEQGHEVVAGFMINYMADDGNCPTRTDLSEAEKVAEYLGIPLYTFDFVKEYEALIMNYMYEGYRKGITPNPDVLCNTLVKFDLFLKEALEYGFDAVATGHYARVVHDEKGISHLLKGTDPWKDQSYFLAGLSQDQLSRCLFPIGQLQKSEVREIAKQAGLPNAERKDSQGLCFIGKVNMKDFLEKKIPKKKWDILDIEGKKIGEHEGAHFYTIGQRKGIGVGGGPALFVIQKNIETNTVIVGTEHDMELYSRELTAVDWHWINTAASFPCAWAVKIRYRQPDQAVEAVDIGNGRVKATFQEPQRAVASGQVIALYQWEELLGSGVIA